MGDTTAPTGPSMPPSPDGDDAVSTDDRAARVDALIARLQDERLEVLPFYHDLRNQIVRPHNLHVETRYFFRQWKPKLGPVLTLLIMELRDRCYYNPRTGERRDYCWPSQEELARAIGVSVRTVIRALQSPLAREFIRVQHRYRYDPALGKKVRTSSAYVVAMDDPLRPEDEPVLTRMLAEQILAEETAQRHLLQAASPSDQNATLADRKETTPESHLTDNLANTSGPLLTDKLPLIDMTDKLAEEEVPPGRVTHEDKKKRPTPTSPRRKERTSAVDDLPEAVARAYADANDRTPTPLERQRLCALIERFDPMARQADPPSTGAAWVLAAIVEAVDSGSAFVAPRRIAAICERWQRTEVEHREKRSRDRARVDAPRPIQPSPRRADAPVDQSAEPAPRLASDEEPVPVDPFDEDPELTSPSFVISATRPVTSWQLWRLVTDELLRQPMSEQYRTWLAQAALVGQEDGALVVGTPSRFSRDLLERRFSEGIERAIALVLGERVAVRFVVTRTWLGENRR